MNNYIPYEKIVNYLDVSQGDILLIGSDITRLYKSSLKNQDKMELNLFIQSFIEKIGEQGTLLFPTYNWGFCRGLDFDYSSTPSQTGILSQKALENSLFKRTQHPIYSFAVWGKDQDYLCNLNNKSAFGEHSPFEYLHFNKAKMLMIDVEYQNSFTFVHYVEERKKVKYRYMKEFIGDYTDCLNNKEQKTYSMYVRDIEKGVCTAISEIGLDIDKENKYKNQKINGVNFRIVDLYEAYEIIQKDIVENNSKKLYRIGSDELL